MKFILMFLAVCALSFSTFAADDHKTQHDHSHKHGKKCGHKAEKHGDHTDYEEIVDGKTHHHKKHGKHYDECDAEDSERTPASKK